MRGEHAASLMPSPALLQQCWGQRQRMTFLDTDLGTGDKLFAVMQSLAPLLRQQGDLHYIALTPSLPALNQMHPGLRALLPAQWLPDIPGMYRLPLYDGRGQLTIMVGQVAGQLGQLCARLDMVLLHDAPWTDWDMRQLSRLSATHAIMLCPASLAPQAAKAGFVWDGQQGVFRHTPRVQQAVVVPRQQSAIVIGAGLAGTAACERLVARGWEVTLVDACDGVAQKVSGNPAGIYMPLLSRDDNVTSQLLRSAYLYALANWERLGGLGPSIIGEACGVLHVARDAEQEQAFRDMADRLGLPDTYARWLEPAQASAAIGRPTHGSWLFPQAGWVRPATVCEAMLTACDRHPGQLERRLGVTVAQLVQHDAGWQVVDDAGREVASAPVVILANGMDVLQFPQAQTLALQGIRGQVTMLPQEDVPVLPHVLCGDGYLTRPWEGQVSIGASYDKDDDMRPRVQSDLENLDKLAELLPGYVYTGPTEGLRSRVGLRCVAHDRLPLVGMLPDHNAAVRADMTLDKVPRLQGLHVLLGYASRGLIWSGLAAELLACQLNHEALPVPRRHVESLDPARFLRKALRQKK